MTKNTKTESGRSMVEMLGVLAVVGVLSVGSIAGYTYAMNKYYTNELLAGASERAVLVAAQIVAGQEPNLNEFAGHTAPGGTFGVVKTDIEGEFGIAVSGVKDAVCENLIKATDGTNVYIANDDEDLTDVTCSGDNNEFLFVFEENGIRNIDVGHCRNGNVYLSYMKDPCSTETPKEMECTKNSDCDKDEFCNLTGTRKNSSAVITNGTCEILSVGTKINYTHNEKKQTLLVGPYLNWWAAQNWCKAHKMSLVNASTLGCSINDFNGYCPDSVYNDLKDVGLVYYYWTGDSFDSNSAWFVRVYNKSFLSNIRYDGAHAYSALCE